MPYRPVGHGNRTCLMARCRLAQVAVWLKLPTPSSARTGELSWSWGCSARGVRLPLGSTHHYIACPRRCTFAA